MTDAPNQIEVNYHNVNEIITRSANKAGRQPQDIKLIVVTKAQPVEKIVAVINAGGNCLGENYPEETLNKIPGLQAYHQDIEWHMIGRLQSRKNKIIVEHFHMVHSIENVIQASKLNRLLVDAKKQIPVLLEMNVSGEDTKGGWSAWDEKKWDDLLMDIEELTSFTGLKICGLMTMPPLGISPEDSRFYFAKLAKLRQFLGKCFPTCNFHELSMGTSSDYWIAIEEGATYVRIGQAIFGPRSP